MKPPRALTLLALLIASVLPASAADRLEQWYALMPKETVAVIAVKNNPELLADWDQSPFAKFTQDEAVQRWMAPMKKDGMTPWDKFFKDHYGQGMHDTLKDYPGAQVSFLVLEDFEEFKDTPPNVSLSEIAGKQKEVEAHRLAEVEAQRKKNEDIKLRTIEINGVTVNVASEGEDDDAWAVAWAVVDDVMIEANSRKLMEYMIGAVKSGAGDAPGPAREHLTRIAQHTQGGSDFLLYFNGVKLLELGEKAIAAEEAKKKEEGKGEAAAFNIKPQQIMDMLGVKELQALALTVGMQGDQMRSDMIILHPEKPTGILSMMRTSANEVTLPGFIPGDVLQGGVVRYDLARFYDNLLGMIMKLGPMAMMVTMQIPQFEQQLGFKIRDDFLASLDDEVISVQDGELLKQNQVMGFKLKDADKIGGALESLKRFVGAGFGAFEESEYLGFKVNTLKLSQTSTAASEVAYCNTGKYLFISVGGQDTLNKVLSRIKDPSGPSIWDSPQVQKLLSITPKNYGSANVTDVGSMINMLATAFSTLEAQAGAKKKDKGPSKKKGPGKKGGDEERSASAGGPMLDSSAIPPKEVFQRYFGRMLGAQYSHPDAIQIHYLVVSPDAQ
ncbi:MAG: hypothetical protein ACO1TE_20615 [Prosthecobacter sp.]